jgi:hypothetical protein
MEKFEDIEIGEEFVIIRKNNRRSSSSYIKTTKDSAESTVTGNDYFFMYECPVKKTKKFKRK